MATAAPGLSRPDAPLTHAEQRRQRRIPRTPDGRPLKPGQRLPTEDDQAEALAANCGYRGAGFPAGGQWELTSQHVRLWLLHNFEARRGDTNHFRALGDLSADEFALFLWDLDCWNDLMRRGVPVPPLELYLESGREHWGWVGSLVRRWRELQRRNRLCSPGEATDGS